MRLKSKQQALYFLSGKTEAQRRHDRKECGCFAGYADRLAIFGQGILWLGRSGEIPDGAMAVMHEKEEETNKVWCEASLEEFKDYWRSVLRGAS